MRAFLAAGFLAAASARTVSVDYGATGWSRREAVRGSEPVSFTVVMKEQGAAEIVRIAKQVSDPEHASYGQYLTSAQIAAIAKPTAADEMVRRTTAAASSSGRVVCAAHNVPS